MRRKSLDNRGVSEVFGVMLVLTVTLIVACLVAVFVGGFSFGAEEQAISANLVASGLESDGSSYAYILFEHVSGDPVDLDAIVISLGLRSSAKMATYIQNTDLPTGKDETGRPLMHYIQNYGDPDKTKITVGDRFVLYADEVRTDPNSGGIYWRSETAAAEFFAPWNDYITYQILDTRSNRPISSGKIPISQSR